MADPSVVISSVAAVISAFGGAFAAVAAFKSAASARDAHEAAQNSEKRTMLRQLMVTAGEVLVEAKQSESRAAQLKLSYRTLFGFGGSSSSSREQLYLSEIDKKLAELTKLSETATPFVSDQDVLMSGPLDEISKREMKIAQTLVKVRAIREDLEREHASVEAQCMTYRDKVIR